MTIKTKFQFLCLLYIGKVIFIDFPEILENHFQNLTESLNNASKYLTLVEILVVFFDLIGTYSI